MSPVIYSFDGYRLALASRELHHDGQRVALTSRVFDCLAYLVEHRDRAVGRDELVAAVWGRVDVTDAQLGQVVLRVRRAVGDDGNEQRAIRTMPKFGYRWVAETAESLEAAATPLPVADPATPPTGAPPPDPPLSAPAPRRYRRIAWAAGSVAVVVVLVLAWAAYRPEAAPPPVVPADAAAALVLPVDVTALTDSSWIRLGAMDAMATRFRRAGLRVPTSESVLALLRSKAPDGKPVTDAVLRQATGAAWIVRSRARHHGARWQVELSATPRTGAPVSIAAEAADPLTAMRSAGDRLLMRLGRVPPADGAVDDQLELTLDRADAAMLANQLSVARAILTRAPELMRRQPQLRYRLAQVDFRAGNMDAVLRTLQGLLDDESTATDALLRGRVLTGLGTVKLDLGRYVESERDFSAAIAALAGPAWTLERGQALGGRGAARAALGNYDAALADLGAARVAAGEAGDRLGMARLDMVEGTLELQRERAAQAEPLLVRAAAQFGTFDAVNERFNTLTQLLGCQLLLLDYDGALATSDQAWPLRARVSDPQLRAGMATGRALTLFRLGRYSEADAVLGQLAGERPAAAQAFAARADYVRALLAEAEGDPARALDLARTALPQLALPEDSTAHERLQLVRERALLALGEVPAAQAALADAAPQAGESPPLVLLGKAELDARGGTAGATREAYERALSAADASTPSEDNILVAASYAAWLMATGDLQRAGSVIGRLGAWSDRDFRCALLEVRLYSALAEAGPWNRALAAAERLAGEREIPAALRALPGGADASPR
jgi:DNA-binding winged helix-turn-helix (wHTH) protein/tetratricopeptide (TPR) repeat protein